MKKKYFILIQDGLSQSSIGIQLHENEWVLVTEGTFSVSKAAELFFWEVIKIMNENKTAIEDAGWNLEQEEK